MGSDDFDRITRLTVALLLGLWLFFIGMKYQVEYPRTLIELTGQPWWRLLIIIGVVAAAFWCPMVGALAAFAAILYLADARALTFE
jgi:hypothetical protein